MTNKNSRPRPRPTFEDLLRALTYFVLMLWSIAFFFFPPVAFTSNVGANDTVIGIWMIFGFTGAVMAFLGSLLRIDIKLELPGLAIAIIGPALYWISQIYFIIIPAPTDVGPFPRLAIMLFALYGTITLLPRIYALWLESRRLKRITTSALNRMRLSPEEEAQPGAGFLSEKVDKS